MPCRDSDNRETERDMTVGKKNFRRYLTDKEREKEARGILRSAPEGRYLTLEEWEEILYED